MKHVLTFSIVFTLAFLLAGPTYAQRTAATSFAANPTPQQKRDLYRAAIDGHKQVALLLPAVQAAREAARYKGPSLKKMAIAYQNKCAYVKRVKGNVNGTQYKKLQADFVQLNKDLDLYIRYHTRGESGSQFSDCYTDCHQGFPGWGGGAGANRFACKFGCFVEATGGRNN